MAALNIKESITVSLGQAGIPVGTLVYVKQGRRENTAFAYGAEWLANPAHFKISPDLALVADYQLRKAPTPADSPFPFALADTAPDACRRPLTSTLFQTKTASRRLGSQRLRAPWSHSRRCWPTALISA